MFREGVPCGIRNYCLGRRDKETIGRKIIDFSFRQLAGCTVLVIGAWLLLEPSKGHILNLFVPDVKPHETINLIAYSLFGLGFIVLTVGFFGCRAALRGNQCILATVSETTFLLTPSLSGSTVLL